MGTMYESNISEEKELKSDQSADNPQESYEHRWKLLEAKEQELKNMEQAYAKWGEALQKKELELSIAALANMKEAAEIESRKNAEEEKIKIMIYNQTEEARKKLDDEKDGERAAFAQEMESKRKKFDEERRCAIDSLNEELKTMRQNARNELDSMRKQQEEELRKKLSDADKKIQDEYKALESEKEKLSRAEEALAEREETLERDSINKNKSIEREKRRLEVRETDLEEDRNDLEKIVNKRMNDYENSRKREIDAKDQELKRLRDQLASTIKDNESLLSFTAKYGDPEKMTKRMAKLEETNKALREQNANSVDGAEYRELANSLKDFQAKYNAILEEKNKIVNEKDRLAESLSEFPGLKVKCATQEDEIKSLEESKEALRRRLEDANLEIQRLTTTERAVADRNARIKAIESGALVDERDLIGAGEGFDSRSSSKDEIEWLEGVWKKCSDYGIKFNKRILYAFHTALKINEWSTITVLAGVSGTGKSELPRLYAEFGGLNFCSVAVQPNWDSQESMLGFFNSIDNQFEPEEVLKFLVQCTTDEKYKDYMSLILLDEMNLAHVEHYFAEFLSKLETRRGMTKKYLPEIEVKLGAGVKPYGLKLARTLLWAGTMNQDETTKPLSDKVLDRGIVINFPRPKKLVSRSKMGLIKDFIGNDRPKMHKETWSSWTVYEKKFSPEQEKELEKYKKMVESINDALEEVGRAIGHRVWQSIEFYIANYPTVRKAMHYEAEKPKEIVHMENNAMSSLFAALREKPITPNSNSKIVLVPTNAELTVELKEAMKTAFEDQIVQKIMPKLRGIETRDKRGKSSLDKIEDLLVKNDFGNLQEDFQIARDQGYGQFIWNSAKYLEEAGSTNGNSDSQ